MAGALKPVDTVRYEFYKFQVNLVIQVGNRQIHPTEKEQNKEWKTYISCSSLKPVWCLSVSVQMGLFFSVHQAAYTGEAATSGETSQGSTCIRHS